MIVAAVDAQVFVSTFRAAGRLVVRSPFLMQLPMMLEESL
jgi:hypothetical protein